MSSISNALTKFKTAITVMTARFANSMFGGMKGSKEESVIAANSPYGSLDPLLAGHMHDGQHADGHAQKINLTSGSHITGLLPHENLNQMAVHYDNVFNTTDDETNSELIPWRKNNSDGTKQYYLNLSEYTSTVVGALTLDSVCTVGNKTDQQITIGSDTAAPESQLDIHADSSSLYHMKLINKDASPSSTTLSMLTGTPRFDIFSKLDSYSGALQNKISLYPVNISSPPSLGVHIHSDQGGVEVSSSSNTTITSDVSSFLIASEESHVQSTRDDGGLGISISATDNSSVEIISNKNSGSGPGVNVETRMGSSIHIGTQTHTTSASPTEEVRFTSEQFNFHPPIRATATFPISSYDHEHEFLNIYDKAAIDGTKKAILTIDLGDKTANPGNPSSSSTPLNNPKIYLGQDAKNQAPLIKDSSIYVRDTGPKLYLDDLTSGETTSPTSTGIKFCGQITPSPHPTHVNNTNVFSSLSSRNDLDAIPLPEYGGKLEFLTHGSQRQIGGARTPYTSSSFLEQPRLSINFDGNIAIGVSERKVSKEFHTVHTSTGHLEVKDYEGLLNLQAETVVENNGDGDDMVMNFSQVYFQNSAGGSPKTVDNIRYVEVKPPDFANSVSSSPIPNVGSIGVDNYTNNPQTGASAFKNKTAAFLNFNHPVRDGSTSPSSVGLMNSAVDEHPMLITNISDGSYTNPSGRPQGNQPMNSIPALPGFGATAGAGYHADVHGWMKVFVDEYDTGAGQWVKRMYFVPLCLFRKA